MTKETDLKLAEMTFVFALYIQPQKARNGSAAIIFMTLKVKTSFIRQ